MGKLSMRKISELLRQRFDLKRSYREIATSLNISVGTVAEYLALARGAGIAWPLPEGITEEGLHQKLFLPGETTKTPKPMPDWEVVYRELRRKGVTLLLLWREHKGTYPNGIGYTQFCVHYSVYVKSVSPVMRQIHKAGEKAFVDYAGLTVPWIDPVTAEIIDAQIFIGCLGASQYTFVEATATQQLPDWMDSHVHLFEHFKGVPEIVVPDNLKSGVYKAHLYDPDINPNYQALGEHYGFAIVPARAASPKDKAKVENVVGCVERQILAPLRDHTFTSLSEINEAIASRLEKFNAQPFQKMKTSRLALYESLDKPALKPLPLERYQYAEWKKAKVNIDYHLAYEDHYYSVPYPYIHQPVEVRATNHIVECFFKNKRIAVHVRSYRRYGYTTLPEHMPEAHRIHAEWTPERMRRWASKIGPYTAQFIEEMIRARPFPQQAYRACLGLLRLGKKHGEVRLEKACAKGLAAGLTRYQQIESMLTHKFEEVTLPGQSISVLPHHDNIRGPQYYE